jgi:electron transfer flavoprotein-quinone oxidoreductase
VEAPLVIACDGTLSFLAQEAGLRDGLKPEHMALGVRGLYLLDEEKINDRFGLTGREGATRSFWGARREFVEEVFSIRRPRRSR